MRIRDILDTMDAGPAPEPADAARAWLAAHREGFAPFVDGAFTAPGDDRTAVSDPATAEPLAAVARCSEAEVAAAVATRCFAHHAGSADLRASAFPGRAPSARGRRSCRGTPPCRRWRGPSRRRWRSATRSC